MNQESNKNEESLGHEVDELLDQGLNQKVIEARGYSSSLVRQRIRKRAKKGKAASASRAKNGALAIRKEKESVLPEWLERDVAEIFDGEVRDQRIFLAGMSVPLMGLRLFAEGVKPIIDLLTTWQQGQAEAAQAAQGSGMEMAKAAGEAAAAGVGKYFMDTKPWLAGAPNPMQAMVVDSLRPMFQQLMGQLMGNFMRFTPQAQGQPGTQPTSPSGQSSETGVQQPGGAQQATEEEIKEAFDEH